MREDRDNAISLIVPAYNEEAAIGQVLEDAERALRAAGVKYEIVVVDDCSADGTARIARDAGVTVLRNVQNGGYGYSLMRGIRHTRYPSIAIVDGDASYPITELPRLIEEYRRGYAMVVAHRQGEFYASSISLR